MSRAENPRDFSRPELNLHFTENKIYLKCFHFVFTCLKCLYRYIKGEILPLALQLHRECLVPFLRVTADFRASNHSLTPIHFPNPPPCTPITARVSGTLFKSNKQIGGQAAILSRPFIFQTHPVKILRQPFCSA